VCQKPCSYSGYHGTGTCLCVEHAAVRGLLETLGLIVDHRHKMEPGEMAAVALESLSEFRAAWRTIHEKDLK
jgi:hypothetical protein